MELLVYFSISIPSFLNLHFQVIDDNNENVHPDVFTKSRHCSFASTNCCFNVNLLSVLGLQKCSAKFDSFIASFSQSFAGIILCRPSDRTEVFQSNCHDWSELIFEVHLLVDELKRLYGSWKKQKKVPTCIETFISCRSSNKMQRVSRTWDKISMAIQFSDSSLETWIRSRHVACIVVDLSYTITKSKPLHSKTLIITLNMSSAM